MSIFARNTGPCEGFDKYAGQKWIYPNNMTIRGYQKEAVSKALFHNAMIVLPTGFGKTFIAAVVMYNFYRWYPTGKIIFVAPTRPLVTQQVQECRKISGIPKVDCCELTGQTNAERREAAWSDKRVFFATPQVIENDLTNGLLDGRQVRCIVIDEAHRAQGGYAYVNIVKLLHEQNKDGFRVLALSATPGSDIERVRQVMENLLISEVMFRSEMSIDLMQYRNEKSVKAWTVELTGKHKAIVDAFIAMTRPIYKQIHLAGLSYADSIEKVPKYCLIKAMEQLRNNQHETNSSRPGRLKFVVPGAVQLSGFFEYLTLYGLRVFYAAIKKDLNESKSKVKTLMASKYEFDKMISDIEAIFGADVVPNPDKKPTVDLLQGHPKLTVVRNLLMEHFRANEEKTETRAIVFTKYRESVFDIVQTLKAYDPFLKPGAFVGQGSATGTGMTQKEQLRLIKDFKAGVYNVIVATCVAEEGLDIGEVDLIVCYDTSASPISTTQRRGRTGRKRTGNVQTILTKGYEEKKLRKAGETRRQVEGQLFKKENYSPQKYRNAPRMVPADIQPVCFEHQIFPEDADDNDVVPSSTRKRRRRRDADEEEDVVPIDEMVVKKKGGRKKSMQGEARKSNGATSQQSTGFIAASELSPSTSTTASPEKKSVVGTPVTFKTPDGETFVFSDFEDDEEDSGAEDHKGCATATSVAAGEDDHDDLFD